MDKDDCDGGDEKEGIPLIFRGVLRLNMKGKGEEYGELSKVVVVVVVVVAVLVEGVELGIPRTLFMAGVVFLKLDKEVVVVVGIGVSVAVAVEMDLDERGVLGDDLC